MIPALFGIGIGDVIGLGEEIFGGGDDGRGRPGAPCAGPIETQGVQHMSDVWSALPADFARAQSIARGASGCCRELRDAIAQAGNSPRSWALVYQWWINGGPSCKGGPALGSTAVRDMWAEFNRLLAIQPRQETGTFTASGVLASPLTLATIGGLVLVVGAVGLTLALRR